MYSAEAAEVRYSPDARPGLIRLGHTFGELVNFNPHLHVLAADGAFLPRWALGRAADSAGKSSCGGLSTRGARPKDSLGALVLTVLSAARDEAGAESIGNSR